MTYLLPATTRKAIRLLFQLFQQVKAFLRPKAAKYKLATILDLILIIAILISIKQPAQGLISPLASSLHSLYSITPITTTKETFAFVPDLAPNKFPAIDLTGLTHLSFFDVPLTDTGGMNYYSRGYQSFISGATAELFDRARYQKTKIFLTLSALSQDIIQNLLDNPDAQLELANQAAEEIRNSNIDGITIDFELPNGGGQHYQEKFTGFIKLLTDNIHLALPHVQVAVAVPSTQTSHESLYNIEALGRASDRIFLIASNFIVPEAKNTKPSNPVFGINEQEYFANISNLLANLQLKIPANKLVMERAWYGNGHNYPLYIPNRKAEIEDNQKPAPVQLNQATIEQLVAGVPQKGKAAARTNIPLIADALAKEGILDSNVLAYALATVEHETDETFQPINEIQGAVNARRFGYEGGANYFGRGFIQITHLRNYREIGERIGMGDKLVKDPDLALNPEVSAKILAAFFKDNNVANLASNGNFIAARTPVNPDYNGRSIAQLALKYDN